MYLKKLQLYFFGAASLGFLFVGLQLLFGFVLIRWGISNAQPYGGGTIVDGESWADLLIILAITWILPALISLTVWWRSILPRLRNWLEETPWYD